MSSLFEDGPSMDFELQWATYRDAADQVRCPAFGAASTPIDDYPGRAMGEVVGMDAFLLAERTLSLARHRPLQKPEVIHVCVGDFNSDGCATCRICSAARHFGEAVDVGGNGASCFGPRRKWGRQYRLWHFDRVETAVLRHRLAVYHQFIKNTHVAGGGIVPLGHGPGCGLRTAPNAPPLQPERPNAASWASLGSRLTCQPAESHPPFQFASEDHWNRTESGRKSKHPGTGNLHAQRINFGERIRAR